MGLSANRPTSFCAALDDDVCAAMAMPVANTNAANPSRANTLAAIVIRDSLRATSTHFSECERLQEVSMLRIGTVSAALSGLLVLPSLVFAQATIAGVVKDASAAILPGVSVEASSSALIEKVRTSVTDGTGQYRITDLPPGTYALTFSLQGFTTVKHEGVAVTGSGVIAVN